MSEDDRFGGGSGPWVDATPSPIAPPAQFAADAAYGQSPYAPVRRRRLPTWAIVAICVPGGFVVLMILAAIAIPVVLNLRSAPVMPDSVGGLTRSTDPGVINVVEQLRKQATSQQSRGKMRVAGYGTVSSGYLVLGLNGRIDETKEFSDLGATEAPKSFGDVRCASSKARTASACLRTATQGSIEIVRLGTDDLSLLATETAKAWAAQPFAD
jgi:hypothetical protein